MQMSITATPRDLVEMLRLQPGRRYVLQVNGDPVRLLEHPLTPPLHDGMTIRQAQCIEVADEPWWCWAGGLGSSVTVHIMCDRDVLGKGHHKLELEPDVEIPDVLGAPPVRRSTRTRSG